MNVSDEGMLSIDWRAHQKAHWNSVFWLKLNATWDSLSSSCRRDFGNFPHGDRIFISLLDAILFFLSMLVRCVIYFCCCCCCCSISSSVVSFLPKEKTGPKPVTGRFHVDQLLFVSVVNHKRWMASDSWRLQSLDILPVRLTITGLCVSSVQARTGYSSWA